LDAEVSSFDFFLFLASLLIINFDVYICAISEVDNAAFFIFIYHSLLKQAADLLLIFFAYEFFNLELKAPFLKNDFLHEFILTVNLKANDSEQMNELPFVCSHFLLTLFDPQVSQLFWKTYNFSSIN